MCVSLDADFEHGSTLCLYGDGAISHDMSH